MNHVFEKFKKNHAALVDQAIDKGLSLDDILALWEKFGPLIIMILQVLTKAKKTNSPAE